MENIKDLFRKYNFTLSDDQIKKFEMYFSLLIEWNKKFNLTSITNEHDVIIKHFLDSVLFINEIPFNAKVIDVGSGAGFPGIPIKIMRDDIDLTMIDSLQKRVGFLEFIIKELKFVKTRAIHSRSEDFAMLSNERETYDICVSRAVARLMTLNEYCLPFVKIGGKFIPSKAGECENELKGAVNSFEILGGKCLNVLRYNIEENSSTRAFPIIIKIKSTPKNYPRQKNLPKIKPIM